MVTGSEKQMKWYEEILTILSKKSPTSKVVR